MNKYNLYSNNSIEEMINDEENDSLFSMNQIMNYTFRENLPNNNFFEKEKYIFNKKNDNCGLPFKDILFSQKNLNKDSSQENIIPSANISIDESSKQQNNINGSNSSSTKDKNQLKNIQNKVNNSDITNNPIIDIDENSKNNVLNNKGNTDKVLAKKRKPRTHLEDLDIDPEIIKNKKFLKIGDKVILSKNQDITENDKKEIRAMRNRISAKKNRDKKKGEFIFLNKKISFLIDELNRAKLIINNYEKICCSQCKLKMVEINQKLLEDNDINKNEINDCNDNIDNILNQCKTKPNVFYDNIDIIKDKDKNNDILNDNYNNNIILDNLQQKENSKNEKYLVLEEFDSFFSNKINSTLGKISATLICLVTLIGIIICLNQELPISKNIKSFNNQQSISSNDHKVSLRHLNNICPNQNENNFIIHKENYGNKSNESNLVIPIESLNFLLICHDKFTWGIYYNLKYKIEQKKVNLLKKRNNENSILDNLIFNETNKIIINNYKINDSNLINNFQIEANSIILNNKKDNKIILVFVKDHEAFKNINGRSLPLIENESKNSEDDCAYLQMIIPKKQIKNSFDKNLTYSENERESDFFEIRCKIFEKDKYYGQGIISY